MVKFPFSRAACFNLTYYNKLEEISVIGYNIIYPNYNKPTMLRWPCYSGKTTSSLVMLLFPPKQHNIYTTICIFSSNSWVL